MKFLLKAGLLTFLALAFYHQNASAETDWAAKCSSFGEIKPNVNPSFQQVNCLLTNAAIAKDIPPEVVKAVAMRENGWKQFDENGQSSTSDDGGIGVMQITDPSVSDAVLERLKTDIVFNIETGVQLLSEKYGQSNLPKIKGANRHVIENWYFPVMAYNGIKPLNSPLQQKDGLKNTKAYQEMVFQKIEDDSFLGDTTLAEFPFKTSDFQYNPESPENIVFKVPEYTVTQPVHTSAYFFKKGDKVVVTQDDLVVREKASRDYANLKELPKNTKLTIDGDFTYDLSDRPNQYVWYPIKTEDQKVAGYVSSAYITVAPIPVPPAVTCTQYKKGQKIFWDGVELKPGQLGRLITLKTTPVFKLKAPGTITRTLPKGNTYRIYAFQPGMLSVGGGDYVMRDTSLVKYETPSKEKLNLVKCIANLK